MLRVVIASAVAVVMASGVALAAPAAKLTDVSGRVLVDSGKGFVAVSTLSEVAPGTRVLVSKNGKATLAYANGCETALSANSITTVKGEGCKAGAQVAASGPGEGMYVDPVAPIVAPAPASVNWLIPAVGGLAVGGLVGYLIGNNSGDDQIIYVPISF